MAVEGPSKAEVIELFILFESLLNLKISQINYKDNKDGTVSVNYLPTAPGEYKISVRFGDKNIKGSPFFAKVKVNCHAQSKTKFQQIPNRLQEKAANAIKSRSDPAPK